MTAVMLHLNIIYLTVTYQCENNCQAAKYHVLSRIL